MNRNLTLILFSVFVVGSFVAYIYYKKNYFPKYDWTVEYKKKSNQPYGLKLFYTTVKNQKSNVTLLNNQSYNLLDTNLINSNFIIVGDDFWVDSIDTPHLLKYVEKGNRLFIASNICPLEVIRNFVPIGDSIYGYKEQRDSLVSVSFSKDNAVPYFKKMSFHYQELKDTAVRFWSIYKMQYFKDTLANYNFVPFSVLNDSNINAFYIPHGKGKIIVQANPILFTNYYMIQENGFKHANNFLSQLHQGPIYWYDSGNMKTNFSENKMANPLKFLFSHTYLKWAWFLFLITILLFLIFRSKREQRIIPLMPINTNASIEFAKAIGTLYFQNKGHNHIANEMYTIFLSDIRSRYNISTDVAETELVDQLAIRSEINKAILYHLFKKFKDIRFNSKADTNDLISLYNAVENYHKKRK